MLYYCTNENFYMFTLAMDTVVLVILIYVMLIFRIGQASIHNIQIFVYLSTFPPPLSLTMLCHNQVSGHLNPPPLPKFVYVLNLNLIIWPCPLLCLYISMYVFVCLYNMYTCIYMSHPHICVCVCMYPYFHSHTHTLLSTQKLPFLPNGPFIKGYLVNVYVSLIISLCFFSPLSTILTIINGIGRMIH